VRPGSRDEVTLQLRKADHLVEGGCLHFGTPSPPLEVCKREGGKGTQREIVGAVGGRERVADCKLRSGEVV
jgi:hypothetical protein